MVFFPSEFIPEYRPAKKYSVFSSSGWWMNRWPLLGWLETFVKIAAWIAVPYIPGRRVERIPSLSPQVAVELSIMLLASILLAVAIIDRLVYREIISMIFVFPNNWAHWSVTMALYHNGRDGLNGKYFRIFCWLMLTGDVVKLLFFAVHDFSRIGVAIYVSFLVPSTYGAFDDFC